MERRLSLLLALGLLASLVACGDQAVTTTTAVMDVEYGTHAGESLTLDMFVPVESEGAPIVLHLPGGGETGAPMSVVDPLVEEGVIVVFVRTARPTAGATTLLADHGAAARAQADRMGCAIRFARDRASELGSDDPVVVLTGFSWGTGLAAHTALLGADLEARWDEYAAEGGPQRQVDCVVPSGSTHVDALVAMAGTYDHWVPAWDGPVGQFGRSYQQERDPELWEFLFSSIGTAPDLKVRLLSGASDPAVPLEMAAEFAAVLTGAGYDVRLETFEGGHSLPVDLAISTIMEVVEP